MKSATQAPVACFAEPLRGVSQLCFIIQFSTYAAVGLAAETVTRRSAGLLTPGFPSTSESACGALHTAPATVEHVGVDHRRRHVAVSGKLLYRPNVVTREEKIGGKAMPLMPRSA